MRKKVQNLKGLSREQDQFTAKAQDAELEKTRVGMGGEQLVEPIPEYNKVPSEVVLKGNNNQWVVFGRDRRGKKGKGTKLDGYGGGGHTQAASLDLVVGRMSPQPQEVLEDGGKVYVDPDSLSDAAFIYMSQKTDIDENMSRTPLAEGKVGTKRARSGIGMKADNIRFVAREGIKLVTGTDEQNSQGEKATRIHGIDLLAGNDDTELQPMVKGDNLKDALDDMAKQIEQLNGLLNNLVVTQIQLNQAIASHIHTSAPPGSPTSPSPGLASVVPQTTSQMLTKVQRGLVNQRYNLQVYRDKYLSGSRDTYINSSYNNTN